MITLGIDYKPQYVTRVFQPLKIPTFQSEFVENNHTLKTPSYPAYGIYPVKHEFFLNFTNRSFSNHVNSYLNSFSLKNNPNFHSTHYQCVKLFKKFFYLK